jgi:hypothetical protein
MYQANAAGLTCVPGDFQLRSFRIEVPADRRGQAADAIDEAM